MKQFFAILLLIIVFCSCKTNREKTWSVESPNKEIKILVKKGIETDSIGLYYSVFYKVNDQYVIVVEDSKLGITTFDENFVENLQFLESETQANQEEHYSMVSGSKKKYSNTFANLNLKFKNVNNKFFSIDLRAYNNGAAFRYEFDEDESKTIQIIKEHSSFNFAEGDFWAHPYDTITEYSPGYETFYKSSLKIGTNAPENKNGWAFPMLFKTQNAWALVSESGFNSPYGASHIHENCKNGNYKIEFAEIEEAEGNYSRFSTLSLPGVTPWRFITIGDELKNIVESHMVTDLAKPAVLENTDWIQPGRATWSWWSESDSPQDYNELVPYIDLASELGWEYSLIDANWNRMKNGSLEDLAAYSKTKNVGLLIWYNSGGKHNRVTEEPRDLMNDRTIRLNEFKRISELGIKGIKVDFFQSDKQEIIKQYAEILEDAATYNLVVNFHGCTLPKGWRKTYPNLLTMEAFRGSENYKFNSSFPEKAPSHITTIPFLRGVVGPTDYTPLTFSDSKYPHLTTYGFELALPIIIESGLVHYAENDEIIKNLPNFILEFLKEVPASWDAIKYLDGYPGKDAIIARKKDDVWFIAGINGENIEKSFEIDISDLNSDASNVYIIKDKNEARLLSEENRLIEDNKFTIDMLPYGGFVAKIK